jgi:antitoxin component of RelBE/YafQ-DinJ toxin-antitoxin module
MLDEGQIEHLRSVLNDRFTAEEVCEALGLTVDDLFDNFQDKVLRTNWSELL